ncbi:hypothetical protein ACFE04_009511 [Oxalis oulophora]
MNPQGHTPSNSKAFAAMSSRNPHDLDEFERYSLHDDHFKQYLLDMYFSKNFATGEKTFDKIRKIGNYTVKMAEGGGPAKKKTMCVESYLPPIMNQYQLAAQTKNTSKGSTLKRKGPMIDLNVEAPEKASIFREPKEGKGKGLEIDLNISLI